MRISDWSSDACSSDLAAIPVNYLTAWQLLVTMGSLSRDETVLIHNAGGGVGLACIDVARHIGAPIIGTASSGKHAFLEERGLHAAIRSDELRVGKSVSVSVDLGGRRYIKTKKKRK